MTSNEPERKRRTEGALAILAALVVASLIGAEFGVVYFLGALYVLVFIVAAMYLIVSVALVLFLSVRAKSLRTGWRLALSGKKNDALFAFAATLVAVFVVTMHDFPVFPYACVLAGFIGGLIALIGMVRGRC